MEQNRPCCMNPTTRIIFNRCCSVIHLTLFPGQVGEFSVETTLNMPKGCFFSQVLFAEKPLTEGKWKLFIIWLQPMYAFSKKTNTDLGKAL